MTVVTESGLLVPERPEDHEQTSVMSMFNFGLAHRFLIVRVATIVCLVVLGTLLLLPRTYTSESSFMLQTRSSLPSNLTGLASQFGVALPLGEAAQSPTFYGDLLSSREMLAAVVDSPFTVRVDGAVREAKLDSWLHVRGSDPRLRREDAIKKLGKSVAVNVAVKTGVVTLDVRTRYAALSEQINARMLSWLNQFNLQKRQSQASAERQFTEARMNEARAQLSSAEDRMRRFAEQNRETSGSPLLSLEQDRLQRDVSMRQQMYSALAQSLDRAKIDEVRDTPVITVLLPPEAPVRPDSRGLVARAFLTGIVGLVLGALLAAVREAAAPRERAQMSETEAFAAFRRETMDDLRHPFRTIGRLVGLRAA